VSGLERAGERRRMSERKNEQRETGRHAIALVNASQLVTMDGHGPGEGVLGIVENGGLLAVDGVVTAVGSSEDIRRALPDDCEIVDARGRLVTPGLVDPHTHVVFAGSRELEFEMRLQGRSYSEIARAGGGIRSSVRALRETPTEVLKIAARRRLRRLMSYGVTTVEVKSGYGLSTEHELRMLEVIEELRREGPMDVVATFLGAHEVPDEYQSDRDAYIDIVTREMIPEVARRGLAKYCDVFCETGVFDVAESRRILEAGLEAGMGAKLHADELSPLGGAELAAELGAVSADHLTRVSERGMRAMADAGVVPVLLPGTSFFLRSEYAPARRMLEIGLPVSLATDLNPGSCTADSLPLIMTIACLNMGMMPWEALSAVTVNAAAAIGLGDRVGRLKPGYQADFVVFEASRYQYVVYHFGSPDASEVYKRGKRVYESER